ncbi:MAG: type II toxin-antitoxin system ParD family antitoxin [Sphingomicrobium sp.]
MAKPTTSFALNDHFRDFAARKVAEGRYGSTSDVIRAGLRLLEEEEDRYEALRQAIEDGENSGPATPFDFDAFIVKKTTAR